MIFEVYLLEKLEIFMAWQDIVAIIVTILAFASLIFLMLKKLDARIILFFLGFIILCIAGWIGRLDDVNWTNIGNVDYKPDPGTGIGWLNPFYVISVSFIKYFSSGGLIIMVLFGYASFMDKIAANDVLVRLLTKPLLKIKKKYLLLFFMFIVGNVLSLVVPSASALAVILMSILYPVLKRSGLSTLSSVAIIATTATIFPTPLGSDTAFITKSFNWSLIGYTYARLAIVALPALLIFAFSHLIWQRFMDKRDLKLNRFQTATEEIQLIEQNAATTKKEQRNWSYLFLPVLPIFVLLIPFALQLASIAFNFGIVEVIILCAIVGIIAELIRTRSMKISINNFLSFFKGMGNGFVSVVLLSTAATIFAQGLIDIGIIKLLSDSIKGVNGVSIALMFIFALIVLVIGSLTGSGTSAVFAFTPIIVGLVNSQVITEADSQLVVIPIQTFANLSRSLSPIAAVIIIVSSWIKVEPIKIIKRTSVPAASALVVVIILSIVFFYAIGLQPIPA